MQLSLALLIPAALSLTSALAQTSHYEPPSPIGSGAVKTEAPYSAEEVNEQVKTLTDGTHITHTHAPTKTYRDSVGRTRRDTWIGHVDTGAEADRLQVIEISDPAAMARYILDVTNKVAHRSQLKPVSSTPAVAQGSHVAAQRDQPRLETVRTDLGTKTIEGTMAKGTLRTTTLPIGSFRHNDRPITHTQEIWRSTELGIVLLSVDVDPEEGVNTWKVTNLRLEAPDPTLFLIPSDYTIVDETGSFEIKK